MKSKPQKYAFRVAKSRTNSGLVVADSISESAIAKLGHGDLVFCQISKPRNPGFHRLAHAFGRLVSENIDGFSGLDAHSVLKRMQIESGIGCDEIAIIMKGVGPCMYRVPKSLSFESMDQMQFETIFSGLCSHVSTQYWGGLDPEEIERMAEVMVNQ